MKTGRKSKAASVIYLRNKRIVGAYSGFGRFTPGIEEVKSYPEILDMNICNWNCIRLIAVAARSKA
jgi:hypothetical protein